MSDNYTFSPGGENLDLRFKRDVREESEKCLTCLVTRAYFIPQILKKNSISEKNITNFVLGTRYLTTIYF